MGPREERHINGAGTEPRQRLVSAVNTNEIMLDMISILFSPWVLSPLRG